MVAMLPLLDIVDVLMKWAQQRNVFICDFVAALYKCQGKLYELYIDQESTFAQFDFYAFEQLLECNHEQIILAFQRDMNKPNCELAFLVGKDKTFVEIDGERIIHSSFVDLGEQIKDECKGMCWISHHALWLIWKLCTMFLYKI